VSRVAWDHLEGWVRGKIQELIQTLLEEEYPQANQGDGNPGIWGALRQVFPEAGEKQCWNHKTFNVLDKLPKKRQGEAERQLLQIACAETLVQAEERRDPGQGLGAFDHLLLVPPGALEAPEDHRCGGSSFAALRLRTDAAKRFKKVENATAVIFKMLLLAQGRFPGSMPQSR